MHSRKLVAVLEQPDANLTLTESEEAIFLLKPFEFKFRPPRAFHVNLRTTEPAEMPVILKIYAAGLHSLP